MTPTSPIKGGVAVGDKLLSYRCLRFLKNKK